MSEALFLTASYGRQGLLVVDDNPIIKKTMYPYILCHVMGSVDGRILTGRWSLPFDGKDKGDLMKAYAESGKRLETDAWMFGKNTLVESFFKEKFVDEPRDGGGLVPELPRESYKALRASERLFVVADPDADIRYTASHVRGDDILVILPETAPDTYLAYLRERGISYLFAGLQGDDLPLAMGKLHADFGVRRLSLQGGGIIDGAFLAAGLLSELSLLVYPGLDGSASSPSIFEHVGEPVPPSTG